MVGVDDSSLQADKLTTQVKFRTNIYVIPTLFYTVNVCLRVFMHPTHYSQGRICDKRCCYVVGWLVTFANCG